MTPTPAGLAAEAAVVAVAVVAVVAVADGTQVTQNFLYFHQPLSQSLSSPPIFYISPTPQ